MPKPETPEMGGNDILLASSMWEGATAAVTICPSMIPEA